MSNTRIPITTNDLIPLVYFIISMFQQETVHRQGTSSKSDLIGGYLDRWINKIPEDIIFNKFLLKDKDYKVVNDYFVYGAQSEKNAPDILGLKAPHGVIPFAKYHDKEWVDVPGMPHVEVKTFRKNQKLVSVREPQLKDNTYYVFVESDLTPDYLIRLFESTKFTSSAREKILMSESFIVSNAQGLISQPPEIVNLSDDNIGSLELIRIISGADFKKRATVCEPKEDALYLKDIFPVDDVRGANQNVPFTERFQYDNDSQMYTSTWDGKKCISLYADKVEGLQILKENKKNFYCLATNTCFINNYKLEQGRKYKVDLELFERSSAWREYIALKHQFSEELDQSKNLVELFDRIVRNSLTGQAS